MISQTAEYALRAVVCLAAQPDARLTTPLIAEVAQIPAGYLAKVMQALGRADIVHSQRGIGGGFTLARDAAQITVLEVVNAVDPVQRIHVCPLGLEAHHDQLCPLHQRLDEAMALVEQAFGATTLAEVVGGAPDQITPLEFPGLLERLNLASQD